MRVSAFWRRSEIPQVATLTNSGAIYDTIIPFMYAIDVDSSCYFVIIALRLHVDPQVLFDNAKIDPATGALICPSRYGANGWEYLNWNISTVSTLNPMRECITRLLLMRN